MPTDDKMIRDDAERTVVLRTVTDADGRVLSQQTIETAKPGSAASNTADITAKASQALGVNAAYLAIASPTPAQVAAQVNRLTRECSAVVRLLLGQLDTTDGT